MHPTPILQRALRRLALTTKQAGKDYYKGTGTGSMGRHTKYGGFIIQWRKVRTYVCPDLADFMLSPFVARRIDPTLDSFEHTETKSAEDGKEYLARWKAEGGTI